MKLPKQWCLHQEDCSRGLFIACWHRLNTFSNRASGGVSTSSGLLTSWYSWFFEAQCSGRSQEMSVWQGVQQMDHAGSHMVLWILQTNNRHVQTIGITWHLDRFTCSPRCLEVYDRTGSIWHAQVPHREPLATTRRRRKFTTSIQPAKAYEDGPLATRAGAWGPVYLVGNAGA